MSTTARATTWHKALEGGAFLGDGGAWLYRAAPTAIIAGADTNVVEAGGRPLLSTLEALSKLSKAKFNRRSASRDGYRNVHILAVNVPRRFTAPDSPIRTELEDAHSTRTPPQRVVAVGVQLVERFASTGAGPWAALRDGSRQLAAMLADPTAFDRSRFVRDEQMVDSIFARARFSALTDEQRHAVCAWWNWGRWTDTPYVPHVDHVHYITDGEAREAIERHPGGPADCSEWASTIAGQHAVTWASVWDWDYKALRPTDPEALWAERLFAHGALAVSIRGRLEPARITAQAIRHRREQLVGDISERMEQAKLDRASEEEKLANLSYAEAALSTTGAWPTLIDASVTVAFRGMDFDLDQVGDGCGLQLKPLDDRQRLAHFEAMPCSQTSANPHQHDLSITVPGYSGLTSFTTIGDEHGALLGFTEVDDQPVWVGPDAAATIDGAPCLFVAGSTGSGKSFLAQSLTYQFTLLGHPTIYINPKHNDSLRPFCDAVGGRTITLDELTSTDGVLDPFRFADAKEAPGLALAHILAANPWGTADERGRVETTLAAALRFGAANGARCTGDALNLAVDAGTLDRSIRDKVFELDDPLFTLGCGRSPTGDQLRVADGLTLIEAGSTFFSIPQPSKPVEAWNLVERVSVGALRLLVFGSGYALAHRSGVVCFDEAHTFFADGSRNEMERLGRLARSMDFLIMLLSQRASDIVDAGLRDFVSRVIGLSLESGEAEALCELLKVDATPERLGRIQAPDSDPNGLRAILGSNRQVVRGSVCFMRDLKGRVATSEVVVPQHLARAFSTNKLDRQTRATALPT